jgi:cell wall-associated NlpC family hydrolase
MNRKTNRACKFVSLLAVLAMFLGACAPAQPAPPDGYKSPYSIAYKNSEGDLTFDFNTSPRNDITLQFDPSQPPLTYANWYNRSSYPAEDITWGPHVVQFSPVTIPATAAGDSKTWKQERVLRVAQKYLGTNYQHHHHPDWFPASDPNWPWQDVSLGHNSKGIDCSDFSSLVYNYGLGIKLITAVEVQATTKSITGPGGVGTITVQTIPGQAYNTLISQLIPGDLLYIRGSADPKAKVSHVIMWIGKNSSSPDVPLIIDSHDNKPPFKDKNGNVVPAGVNIRPFEESGWYYKSFDHAHRIIQ